MTLYPLPKLLEPKYDTDALVYISDNKFYYGRNFDKNLKKDIEEKTLQIYTGYYEFWDGWDSPKLYYLGRGKHSGKFKLKIQGFYPYCYVPDINGEYKDYLGNRCTKLIFKGMHPGYVAEFRRKRERNHQSLPLESDILFHRRFLFDVYDYFKSKNYIEPRIAIVDIETNHPVSDEIISWALNDMEDEIKFESKYDTNNNEYVLIIDLIHELEDIDIVAGWNFINFDANEINRVLEVINKIIDYAGADHTINWILRKLGNYGARKIEEAIYRLDELGYIKINNYHRLEKGNRTFPDQLQHYITVLDLLQISKKMYAREIKGRWSLDNVGEKLCGISKVHLGSVRIGDLPEDKLMEYNVMDVIIPEIIDNTLGGLLAHTILSWSLQIPVEDTVITAVVNDAAILRAYHKHGIVLPTRDFSAKDDSTYKAAEPDARPGVYSNVLAFDLHAAYPSVVLAINASAETKDPNGIYEAPNGVRFNDKESVFIKTLESILKEREKVKKKLKTLDPESSEFKMYKFIDFALKTQTAAFSHGIFGWHNSRMKDLEVADAITSVVRDMIQKVKDHADNIGNSWIYAHTDSVYVLGNKSEKDEISEKLNDVIKEYCKKYKMIPRLDFKSFYEVVYIHSKARNVLLSKREFIDKPELWDEYPNEVTGMNFMRSEVPEPLAEIEIKCISMKMKNKNNKYILEKLKEMVVDLINKDPVELGLIKPLTKPIREYGRVKKDGTIGGYPYHIKALMRAEREFNLQIKVGDKFMILPILLDEYEGKRVRRRKKAWIAFDPNVGLPKEYRINYIHYLRSNLWGKISNLFDMTPKELEEAVMTEEVKGKLFVGML